MATDPLSAPPRPSPARGPRVLIVAGSDSGGGAGIQADVKTVTMLGGHAMTAVTAITAQNTLGVAAAMPVPAAMVVAQMRACLDDIGADTVKIGMIGSAETAHAVADVLAALPGVPVVFDPVMIATSGAVLADDATIAAFDRLAGLATLVTPNTPELERWSGHAIADDAGQERAAHAVMRRTGTAALLAKGGHAADGSGAVVDTLYGGGEPIRWAAPRIDTRHAHGTGCTLASAVADGLGRGLALTAAIERARRFVRLALLAAPGLGGGSGPMGHGAVRMPPPGAPLLDHTTLPMDDSDASTRFLHLLGLRRIVASGTRYARFEDEGGTTLSVEARGEMDGGPVLFLEYDDLEPVIDRLRAAGVAVADPVDRPWGWQEARLRDPAGNALCLFVAGERRRHPSWRLADG